GVGDVTISNSLTWAGQSMSGLGTTTVLSGATFSITGSITVDRSVVNAGTATWTSGTIGQSSGSSGTFINQGTFNAQANAGVNVPFTNASVATLNRSGSGTSSFTNTFTSGGAVNVTGGALSLTNTVTVSSAVNISSAATLQLTTGSNPV